MPGSKVCVRAEVVLGGVHAEGLLPGYPGLELPAADREFCWPGDDRHAWESDPRDARSELVHPASIAAITRDQDQVKSRSITL